MSIKKYQQKLANIVVNKKISTAISPDEFVRKALKLLLPKQTDEKCREAVIRKMINDNNKAVKDYNKGRVNFLQF